MGGGKLCEGIYWGDAKWLHDHKFSWFPDNVFKGRPWPMSEEHRSVKLTDKITSQVPLTPDDLMPICQATAVYRAQISAKNKPTPDHCIVKIFMR
jgi:hypothetical protein